MSLTGIDKNWVTDTLIGGIIGVGVILLSNWVPFISAIGIPSISVSVAGEIGRWIIVVIVAAISEEIFFREFVLDFFDDKLKNFGIDFPYVLAAAITSILFALFHFTAYSGSLSAAQGSFLSAGVFGFGLAYLRKWTKSVLPCIVVHAIFNAWILSKLMFILV